MIEATTNQRGPCQVRSKTEHPCPHQAVVEIQGIPFCEGCACEQKAYFTIGEMTQELTIGQENQLQGLHHIEPLS